MYVLIGCLLLLSVWCLFGVCQGPKTRFLDTLSLHVCVAGQTTHQQHVWKAFRGTTSDEADPVSEEDEGGAQVWRRWRKPPQWLSESSPSSLEHAYQLHCGDSDLDKSLRSVFVKGSMSDIREDFQVGTCTQVLVSNVVRIHHALLHMYA